MMPKDLYEKNLANIRSIYGDDKEAGQRALNKLNEAARVWQPKPSTPAPVAPAAPADPRIRTDPRFTGVLGSPEKQAELNAKADAEKAAFNNMSTQEQIADQVGKMLGVSSNIAMLASVPTLLAGGVGAIGAGGKQFMTNLANKGWGTAIGKGLLGAGKTTARVVTPIVGAAKAAGEVDEFAQEHGVGPKTSQLLGNVAGATVGAVSNPILNKVLPIPRHHQTGKQPNRTGPQWAQKVVDFFGENTHPGGREAYHHPKGGEIIANAKTYQYNRAQDIKAPALVAQQEMEKAIKKMGPETRKATERAVTVYYKNPTGYNRMQLPEDLRDNMPFLEGLKETNRRFNDFTDAHEINYKNVYNVVKKEPAFAPMYNQRNGLPLADKVKKQDVLNYVADMAEGKFTLTPEEKAAMSISPITAHMQRSPLAAKNIVAALRNPNKAPGGSVEFEELVDHYLPRRYLNRVQGIGYEPDPEMYDEAVLEQIRNRMPSVNKKMSAQARKTRSARAASVGSRKVANLVGSGAPGAAGGATPTTVTHAKKLKLDEYDDAALMRAMGRIEDPFYLLDDAIDNVTSAAAKRREIDQLIQYGLLTKTPQNINDKRISVSVSNSEPGSIGTLSESNAGGSYFTPNTFARALVPKERDKLAAFRNLTDASRRASVIGNFASQVRNAAGDELVGYLGGATVSRRPADIAWAAKNIKAFNNGVPQKADELSNVLRENGILGTGFVQANKIPSSMSRSEYTKKRTGSLAETATAAISDKIAHAPGMETMEKIANTEQVRRLAFARDAFRRRGGNEAEGFDLNTMPGMRNTAAALAAVQETNRVLLNYRDKSVLTNFTNAFAPVSSWTVGSSLNAPGLLLENPGRAVAAGYAMKSVNDLLDPLGVSVNFAQNLPLGNVAQAAQDVYNGADLGPALMRNMKGVIRPGLNPYVTAAEALYGSTLDGYQVYNDTDSLLEKTQKGVAHAVQPYIPANYRLLMPYTTANPKPGDATGGTIFQMIASNGLGHRDRVTGENRMPLGMGAARLLGVPLVKDTQGTIAKQILNANREIGMIKSAIKKKAEFQWAEYGRQLDTNDPLMLQLMEQARIIESLTQKYNQKGGGTNGRQN